MTQDRNKDILQHNEVKISILDFLIVIMNYKKLIFIIVTLTGLLSSTYYLVLKDRSVPPVPKVMYRSECLIKINPSEQINIDGTNLENMALRMKSNELFKSIFSKCQIQNSDFRDIKYDHFVNMFRYENVTITAGNSAFQISVDTSDPQLCQNLLICFVRELSNYLCDNTMKSLEARKLFLRQRYESSQNTYSKQSFDEQISSIDEQIKAIMAQEYYVFSMHTSPSAPKEYYQGSKSANPISLIVFSLLLAFILSITLSFFLEYLHNVKEKEPGKLQHLKKLLFFKNQKS